MDTTAYLMSSKKIRKRLYESMKQIEKGEIIKVTLEELMSNEIMKQKYIQHTKKLQK